MECPNCHTDADHKVIWGPRNFRAALLNALSFYFWSGFWPFVTWKRVTTPPRPLKRRCLPCGYKFMGDVPEVPDFDECAQCGYILKGNTSGRCPECNWKLPRRYRAYRRLADRELRKGSRRS